jgi:nucleotide-binding universal stress UspA family protein
MANTVETRTEGAPAVAGSLSLFPVKHIVVPIDLSADSLKGVPYAVKLAQHFDSVLTVLHVFKHPPPLGAITGYYFSDDFDQSRRVISLLTR